MPEGYAHVRTGRKALLLSRIFITDLTAFGSGTQGPDPMFFHIFGSIKDKFKLPHLAAKMHCSMTGAFLCSLVKNAELPIEKSYALGFLTHYATDRNIHPYVAFLTAGENALYDMPQGHGFFEIALDSALYKQDFYTKTIDVSHSTPTLAGEKLMIICRLLKKTIKEVYGEEIKAISLKHSFKNIRIARKALTCKTTFKKRLLRFAERYLLRKENLLSAHSSPANFPVKPPSKWQNPFTFEFMDGGIYALLKKAEKDGACYIKFADSYWKGNISIADFSRGIGNYSYSTNLSLDHELEAAR